MIGLRRRRVLRTFVLWAVGGSLLCFSGWLFLNRDRVEISFKFKSPQFLNFGSAHSDDSVGCRVPQLKPWDQTIARFFKKPDPFTCSSSGLEGISVKHAKVQLSSKLFENCTIQDIIRQDDNHQTLGPSQKLVNASKVPSDFVKISCGGEKSNYYATVKPLPEVLSRKPKESHQNMNGTGLNVFMFGFDSTSRMNFYRQMPKSREYFENNLEGVILEGYNIVGDGTPQALIPILTGQTEEELPLTRKRYASAKFVDDVYPFVWNDFRDAGYATMFVEDGAAVGTFQYRLKGFRNKATDHYSRPFMLLAGSEKCIAHEIQHEVFFRYARELLTAYPPEIPKFAFAFHSAYTHEDINNLNYADEYIRDYMEGLERDGLLNNTLLIFMADHGHRFASLRGTHQGQLEERLPLFGFAAPKWWKEKNPEAWRNLRTNRKRLSTPFDIYPTLQAMYNWREPKMGERGKRSLSLWDEIPVSRSCKDAGVEDHWCTCLSWTELSPSSNLSLTVANVLIDSINEATKADRKLCSELKVKEIISIQRQMPNEKLLKYKGVKDKDGFVADLSGHTKVDFYVFRITIIASPGGGKFESTFRYSEKERNLADLKEISRINKYGDTPHCIRDFDANLRQFCVCYDRIGPT